MITEFTGENLKDLRRDISAALETVRKKYSLKELKIGNISYSANKFTSRLTAVTKNAKSVSSELTDYAARDAELLGINPALIGRKFKSSKRIYTLKHFKLGSPKYPIICDGSDGVEYKLSVEMFNSLTLLDV